jgi:hypothetical protein
MYKKQMLFQTLGDEFREIPEIRSKSGHFCAISEIREIVRKNMFYRIRSAQQVPPGFRGNRDMDIFFQMSQIQKSAKKKKNAKNAKMSRNTPKFWVFYRK